MPIRPPLESTIVNAGASWFSEIEFAPIDTENAVQPVPGFEIGHFITMSFDQTVRVGCIATQYESQVEDSIGIKKFSQLTCNFFLTPFLGSPLFSVGPTCSACKDCNQNDPNYGLCIVDPNTFSDEYRFDDST